MCLTALDSAKERKEIKDSIGKDGMKVYKVVGIKDGRYYPVIRQIHTPYSEGVGEADTSGTVGVASKNEYYQSGFHFWVTSESAKKYLKKIKDLKRKWKLNPDVFQGPYKVIECVVKKSWITATGEDGLNCELKAVVVTSKAIFPKFEEIG